MLNADLIEDINNFTKYLEFQLLSINSILAYCSDLKKSFEYIQNIKNIETISKQDIESCTLNDWRSLFFNLQLSNKSPKTQERYLIALKTYSKFKEKEQKITLSLEKLKNFKIKTTEQVMHFSKEEILKFLDCFNTPQKLNEHRNQALVYLLYSTGLRINEALSIQHGDLFDKYIKINGKGNKIRMVPFFPKIKIMLKNYIDQTKHLKHKSIFLSNNCRTKWHACSVARLFREVCLKNNLKFIHPHMLRHACATHLLEANCNLRSIQALLGHANLEITKKYINFSYEDLKNKFFKIKL